MNTPTLTRPKSIASMATIVVDMGNRSDAELVRMKSNGNMDEYSPSKKPNVRPEPVSRIHCIPLLMLLVFFVLWTASSEVLPGGNGALPEIFVMKLDPSNKMMATVEEQPNDNDSQHGARALLEHSYNNPKAEFHAKGDESQSLKSYRSPGSHSLRGTRT